VQILFYAIDPTADLHGPAARWLEHAINDREPLGLAWPTRHRFPRLGTHPAFPGCMTGEEAMGWVEEWIDTGVEVVGDADLRWGRFVDLLEVSRRSLSHAIDGAYLAAIAISRGATLASFDQDFEPFLGRGLRWEMPGNGSMESGRTSTRYKLLSMACRSFLVAPISLPARPVERKAPAERVVGRSDVVSELVLEPLERCERTVVVAEQHVVGSDLVAFPRAVVVVAKLPLLLPEPSLVASETGSNLLLYALRHQGRLRFRYEVRGFDAARLANRLKSRSAVQSSRTPCARHNAAMRASCTRGPAMRPATI